MKLNFEGVLKLVGLIGATCIALMAIGTLVVKISKGIVNLVRLVDDIHKGMQSQKDDSKILFKSQLACLDGLIQNGANGPVTKAKKNLEEYIFERFGGD